MDAKFCQIHTCSTVELSPVKWPNEHKDLTAAKKLLNYSGFWKNNLDSDNERCIIILTEPTTPLIFMRNPVGLFHLGGVLCISIQSKY